MKFIKQYVQFISNEYHQTYTFVNNKFDFDQDFIIRARKVRIDTRVYSLYRGELITLKDNITYSRSVNKVVLYSEDKCIEITFIYDLNEYYDTFLYDDLAIDGQYKLDVSLWVPVSNVSIRAVKDGIYW